MLHLKKSVSLAVLALALGSLAAPAIESLPRHAEAQIGGGTGVVFGRVSDSTVTAWAARSGDGTKEYWAYVQGEFEFASSANTLQNPWKLGGIYDGGLPTGNFDAFRTEVLSRPGAQGKTIIFHNMTVTESTTVN